jgi:SIR2-like domain
MAQTTVAQSPPTMLTEDMWRTLLDRIHDHKCTPFLGAESTGSVLPPRSTIAESWAKESDFPLEDSSDLARVAQFIATKIDALTPRDKIVNEIKKVPTPDFKTADEPHGILASLPLPVYITTDYHNFMFAALKSYSKDARQEFCRWNDLVKDMPSAFDSQPGKGEITNFPDVANPVVFHLYGHTGVEESLVLTEDDYLQFLVETSKDSQRIPPPIQGAFTRTALFLGYRLTDLEFRVLLRTLAVSLDRSKLRHVSVQVIQVGDEPQTDKEIAQLAKTREYLSGYCEEFRITTYWGTTHDFLVELKQRWDAFPK